MRIQTEPGGNMLRRAATFITVAYVVFMTALPTQAIEHGSATSDDAHAHAEA